MQLWTYHPAEFQVDDRQSPGINPKQGQYWYYTTLCYKSSLRLLLKMLVTEQFPLWCFTVPDCLNLTDVTKGPVEWELDVPEPEVLAFIREPVWEAILSGDGDDWENLVIKEKPLKPAKDITAVVRFPLSPGWGVNRRGKVVPKIWRDHAINLKGLPLVIQRRHIQMYRDHAADVTMPKNERDLYASRAEYLEDYLGLK